MLSTHTVNLIPYEGVSPQFASTPIAALPGHAVVGRVTLGHRAWLGAGSVIRADGHYVTAGDDFQLGRGATVHISHERYPTVMGHRVRVGAGAVVHACHLGNDVLVEEGSVILDGASVGDGAVIAAGSIVYPRSELEGGMLYAGRPAKPVRRLTPLEYESRANELYERNLKAKTEWLCRPIAATCADSAFIAKTAGLLGDVRLEASSSVWFGCQLDAQHAPISIGERCNVQDNSILIAQSMGITLGADTTIGHNVTLEDCSVGARCLVGMGSLISTGTEIPDNTFVAAGCVTAEGQKLSGGYVWGGNPAKIIGNMDDKKIEIILITSRVYAEYAQKLKD